MVQSCAFLLRALKSRLWPAVGAIVLAVVIIPYQLWLGARLLRVQSEAARIVTYAYEEHARTGAYPVDLSGYHYHDPSVRSFVQRYAAEDRHGGFQLVYRVGTENTSHWYSPKDGWAYYPD